MKGYYNVYYHASVSEHSRNSCCEECEFYNRAAANAMLQTRLSLLKDSLSNVHHNNINQGRYNKTGNSCSDGRPIRDIKWRE